MDWYLIGVYKWNITWSLGHTKFLFSCLKILLILFSTQREISYLRVAVYYPLYINLVFTKSVNRNFGVF